MAKNRFEGEWTISTSANPVEFKNIVTPTFSPFSCKNTTFCFEAWYQEVVNNSTWCLFKLKLVKNCSAFITQRFEVIVDVSVNYSDGTLFAEYRNMSLNSGMNYLTFNDAVREKHAGFCLSEHSKKMMSNALIIKCKMSVLDHTPNEEISCNCVDILRNLKSIYESSVLSDFVFKIGEKSFPAHKNILAAHSPVFMKMMTHEFLESKDNSVTITDATPEVFELFLRSLYGGELDDKTWESVKELYYLVDKYDVEFLKIECSDVIISMLDIDSLCEILKLAYNFSNSDLKDAAVKFAINHIKEIVLRDDWKELVETHPKIGYDVIVNFVPKQNFNVSLFMSLNGER